MSELQQGAVEVAKILRDAGYEVFYAGGSVRDLLLGLEPKDFDLVTNAKPQEIDALFRRTVLVGANFGVVRVLWSKRREYEVATYRREGKYTDGRRPDEVIYSDSKEEDVQRRDFTINALLMDPFTQEIFDFVSGEDDLSKREIRAVGHAETRFQEDRLRLLRAIRFAARFNFEIENETYESICRNAQFLREVSVERIVAELDGIWKCSHPALGYRLLVDSELAQTIFPKLRAADHAKLTEWTHHVGQWKQGTDEQRIVVCWSMLAYFQDKDDREAWLTEFKFSRARIRAIQSVLSMYETLENFSSVSLAEQTRLVRDEKFDAASFLFQATHPKDGSTVRQCEELLADLEENPLPPLPMIDGKNLAQMGFRPGPLFKRILREVEDRILERKISSKAEAQEWVLSQKWD